MPLFLFASKLCTLLSECAFWKMRREESVFQIGTLHLRIDRCGRPVLTSGISVCLDFALLCTQCFWLTCTPFSIIEKQNQLKTNHDLLALIFPRFTPGYVSSDWFIALLSSLAWLAKSALDHFSIHSHSFLHRSPSTLKMTSSSLLDTAEFNWEEHWIDLVRTCARNCSNQNSFQVWSSFSNAQ